MESHLALSSPQYQSFKIDYFFPKCKWLSIQYAAFTDLDQMYESKSKQQIRQISQDKKSLFDQKYFNKISTEYASHNIGYLKKSK